MEKSVILSEMQERYLSSIFAARTQIESNLNTAVGMALAQDGIDLTEGMSYRIENGSLIVTIPEQ